LIDWYSCEHGSLTAYTQGSKLLEEMEAGEEFCGTFNETFTSIHLESTNPRLILVFNSTPSFLVGSQATLPSSAQQQSGRSDTSSSSGKLVNSRGQAGFRARFQFITGSPNRPKLLD